MISHFTGGNTAQPPEPVLSRAEWDRLHAWETAFTDEPPAVPFLRAVRVSHLLVQCGSHPIIAAAAVHRSWFAMRRARRSTVPGVSDDFVAAVQEAIHAEVR